MSDKPQQSQECTAISHVCEIVGSAASGQVIFVTPRVRSCRYFLHFGGEYVCTCPGMQGMAKNPICSENGSPHLSDAAEQV